MRSVATMTDIVADSANTVPIGAIAVLGFFVGISIILIIAKVIKGRRDPKRKKAMVADQQWLSDTGKGTLLSRAF